jgi:hypothetical protein
MTLHYAIYEQGNLEKPVILNTHFYNDTTTAGPVKEINVTPVLGEHINYRRLTALSTIAKTGVTWAGQTVDGSGKIVGSLGVEGSSDGKVELFASEAMILERA